MHHVHLDRSLQAGRCLVRRALAVRVLLVQTVDPASCVTSANTKISQEVQDVLIARQARTWHRRAPCSAPRAIMGPGRDWRVSVRVLCVLQARALKQGEAHNSVTALDVVPGPTRHKVPLGCVQSVLEGPRQHSPPRACRIVSANQDSRVLTEPTAPNAVLEHTRQ